MTLLKQRTVASSEIHKQMLYSGKQYRMYYLRTQANNEVDVILDRPGRALTLIEIKSTNELTESNVSSFKQFFAEFPEGEFMCLSQDPRPKRFGRIEACHWREGLERLF